MELKRFFLKNTKYIFLFLLFLFSLTISFVPYEMDTYANYAFSYALAKGEIAYIDFNLIVPLFGPFLYSIGLNFSHSIIMLYLEQALLLTIFSYYLFKILNSKAWLFLLILFLPWPLKFPYILYPGYNFLTILILCILIYMDMTDANDKYVGLFLGIACLTKQTVGFLFLIVNLIYYRKNLKKVLKRFTYFLIPILIFLIYLIFTKSFFAFFNFCFLGMIDFTSTNKYISIKYLSLILIFLILIYFQFRQSDKNISYYYLMAFVTIAYPVLDDYHTTLLLVAFLLVFLYNSKIKITSKKIASLTLGLMTLISIVFPIISYSIVKNLQIYHLNNFPFKVLNNTDAKIKKEILNYLDDKKHIFLLGQGENVLFNIISERKIDYYTILNYGNHGHNGTTRMLNKLEAEKNVYIVVDTSNQQIEKKGVGQFMIELQNYVEKTTKLDKQIGNYKIYYKE